jgi:hypothetical protein
MAGLSSSRILDDTTIWRLMLTLRRRFLQPAAGNPTDGEDRWCNHAQPRATNAA